MNKPEQSDYIPYLATAEEITTADNNPGQFLLSIYPNATESDLDKFRHYVVGKVHDGLEVGIGIGGGDPISNIEAYQQGVQDASDYYLKD